VGAVGVCALATLELNVIWVVKNINKTPSDRLQVLSFTNIPDLNVNNFTLSA
jgi:hypothetical protein